MPTNTLAAGSGAPSADYSSFAAWWAALPSTFTEDVTLQIRWASSSNVITTGASLTGKTFAGYRLTIEAYPGEGFNDHANKLTNALRYNASNGAAIEPTSLHSDAIYLSSGGAAKVTIRDLQISQSTGGGVYGQALELRDTTEIVVENCIIRGTTASSRVVQLISAGSVSNADSYIRNNVFHATVAVDDFLNLGRNGNADRWNILGNTFVNTGSAGSSTGFRIANGYHSYRIHNNVIAGFNTDCVRAGTETSQSHNATDKASGTTGFGATNRQTDLVAGDEWENVTTATADFRVKSTAPKLINNGTASYGASTDILGQSRTGAGTDIGAFEYQIATAPQIAVTGNGNAITDGQTATSLTDHTDFGSITEGGTPTARTYVFSNPGDATLNISGTSVPSGFTVLTALPSTIATGGVTQPLVIEMPNTPAGTYSGNVSVTHDAPGSPFTFAITATVNPPAPPPPPPPGPSAGLSAGKAFGKAGSRVRFAR